jgi:hypothetical protein
VPATPPAGAVVGGPANAGAANAANATQEIIIRFMFLFLFKTFRVEFCLLATQLARHSNGFATGFRRCFKLFNARSASVTEMY